MKKTQRFKNQNLSIDGMRKLDAFLTGPEGGFRAPDYSNFRLVYPDKACWDLNCSVHFLDRYDASLQTCYERARGDLNVIVVNYPGSSPETKLIVAAPEQKMIDSIFDVMERCLAESVVQAAPSRQRFCRRPVARRKRRVA